MEHFSLLWDYSDNNRSFNLYRTADFIITESLLQQSDS